MENIHFTWSWDSKVIATPSTRTDTVTITRKYDSTNKVFKADTLLNKKAPQASKSEAGDKTDNGKHYLLWAAYCLLAAAAGFRFINMLIDKIVLEQKLEKTEKKNAELDKTLEKQAKQNEVKEKEVVEADRRKAAQATANLAPGAQVIIPVIGLPPIKHRDDPQKGRFGGLAQKNGRKLSAQVEEWQNDDDWFKVRLWVESTDNSNPLTGNVTFYLHNTFYKPVRTIAVTNGIAEIKLSQVYGAFTVGAIADNGNTFLELDLAEQKNFPKTFRER